MKSGGSNHVQLVLSPVPVCLSPPLSTFRSLAPSHAQAPITPEGVFLVQSVSSLVTGIPVFLHCKVVMVVAIRVSFGRTADWVRSSALCDVTRIFRMNRKFVIFCTFLSLVPANRLWRPSWHSKWTDQKTSSFSNKLYFSSSSSKAASNSTDTTGNMLFHGPWIRVRTESGTRSMSNRKKLHADTMPTHMLLPWRTSTREHQISISNTTPWKTWWSLQESSSTPDRDDLTFDQTEDLSTSIASRSSCATRSFSFTLSRDTPATVTK